MWQSALNSGNGGGTPQIIRGSGNAGVRIELGFKPRTIFYNSFYNFINASSTIELDLESNHAYVTNDQQIRANNDYFLSDDTFSIDETGFTIKNFGQFTTFQYIAIE